MGFSTLLILICHSIKYVGINNGVMYHLLIQGNRGVDIFLFLSGIGIYYSLNRFFPPPPFRRNCLIGMQKDCLEC